MLFAGFEMHYNATSEQRELSVVIKKAAENVIYQPDGRRYFIQGKEAASCSQILKRKGLQNPLDLFVT